LAAGWALPHQQAIIRINNRFLQRHSKYGLGTGFNIHAKARAGLLNFDLFGIIDYSTVSGEGEGEPGKDKVHLKQDLHLICQFRYFH